MFFPESYLSALGFFYNAYVSYLPDDRAGDGQTGCSCNRGHLALGVFERECSRREERGCGFGSSLLTPPWVLQHNLLPQLASSVSFLVLKGRVTVGVLTV